jgi:hypothetical protein
MRSTYLHSKFSGRGTLIGQTKRGTYRPGLTLVALGPPAWREHQEHRGH